MNKLMRLLNVLRKRKLGILIGLMVGVLVFLAVPMSFSFVYSSVMAWEAMHLNGLFQVGANMLTFTLMMVVAIAVLTGMRALIAQLFRCRWYKTR